MKNKHLLRKFMTENNIDFDVPFIVVNSKNKTKYSLLYTISCVCGRKRQTEAGEGSDCSAVQKVREEIRG